MVQKIIKNMKNKYIWEIIKTTYKRNLDWIWIETYRKEMFNNGKVEHDSKYLSGKEYQAIYDFIGTFCPNWDSPNNIDDYGKMEEEA